MDTPQRLLAVLALLGLVSALAVLVRSRRGRLVRGRGPVTAAGLVTAVGAPLPPTGAVVQLSTRWCSACPGAARVWRRAATDAGADFHEIDVTERVDLARDLDVLSTPTTLLVAADGSIRGRVVGAPDARRAREAVAVLTTQQPGPTRRAA